ncbi:hypothetical protein [Arthrobacter sp.]|uniref:hypothetical protein n=1 Tax=Arthrobacter sp. TaxID=1667 RepID=UPI003A90D5CE
MDAAAVGLPDVEDIADWLSEEEAALIHSHAYKQATAVGKQALFDITWGRLWPVLARWAETGIWFRPEVDIAPEDISDAERVRADLVLLAQRQADARQRGADVGQNSEVTNDSTHDEDG